MQLSLQMYTVRHAAHFNLRHTLFRIARLGYSSIELARIPLSSTTLKILQQASTDYGINVFSAQLKFKQIENVAFTVPFLKQINCKVAVVSALPLYLLKATEAELTGFFIKLNQLGDIYQQEGIRLAYHHHDYEAVKFNDKRGFDILDETLDFEKVKLVCDTFWLQKSGFNPQEYILSHSNAVEGVHLKDYNVQSGVLLPSVTDCALGQGMLDIKAIVQAAKDVGTSYCCVEQNSNKPFDDIYTSIKFLQESDCNNCFSFKKNR